MKKLIFLTLVLIALVGGAFYINTKGGIQLFPTTRVIGVSPTLSPTPSQSPTTEKTTSPTSQQVTQDTTEAAISVQKGKIVSGPKKIMTHENSILILEITSDKDQTLTVSGYDDHVRLLKNTKVVLSFPTKIIGKFSLTLEGSPAAIGTLEVTQ